MEENVCPGCGCLVASGLLYFASTGQPLVCCNERCLTKAQKRGPRTQAGASRCPAPPSSPPEPESCWSTLSHDVLRQLGTRLALPERLAASLACRHWRQGMTQDVTQVHLRVDDVTCGEARRRGTARACSMLDGARTALPAVHSMALTVFYRCLDHTGLSRQLHAVSRWTQLRHLRIRWDATPFDVRSLQSDDFTSLPHLQPGSPALCACKPCSQQRATVKKLARGTSLDASKLASLDLPSRVDASVLGAVGRLTALESLSIVADFVDNPGLNCLSSLVRLTSLQLLYGTTKHNHGGARWDTWSRRWGMHDTDLVCLTQLQRLHVTAQMVSPSVVSALGDLPSLTHMHLDQLDWRLYGGIQEPAGDSGDFVRGRDLAKALRGLTHLKSLRLTMMPNECSTWHSEEGEELYELFSALRDVTQQQVQRHQVRLEQQQQQQPSLPQPSRRRKRRGGGASGRGSGGSPGAAPPHASSQSQQQPHSITASPQHHHPHPLAASRTGGLPHTCCCREAGVWDKEQQEHQLEEQLDEAGDLGVMSVYIAAVRDAEDVVKAVKASDEHLALTLTPAPPLLEMFTLDRLGLVAGVYGLRHLELGCQPGPDHELHPDHTLHGLPQLTALTHLSIRCCAASRLHLPAHDLAALPHTLTSLRTLVLHAGCAAFTPELLGCLPAMGALRLLDLAAMPCSRRTEPSRQDVRQALVAMAAEKPPVSFDLEAQGAGGGGCAHSTGSRVGGMAAAGDGANSGGTAEGDGDAGAREMEVEAEARAVEARRRQVDSALGVLITLREMLQALGLYGTRQALGLAAEWAAQQQQQVQVQEQEQQQEQLHQEQQQQAGQGELLDVGQQGDGVGQEEALADAGPGGDALEGGAQQVLGVVAGTGPEAGAGEPDPGGEVGAGPPALVEELDAVVAAAGGPPAEAAGAQGQEQGANAAAAPGDGDGNVAAAAPDAAQAAMGDLPCLPTWVLRAAERRAEGKAYWEEAKLAAARAARRQRNQGATLRQPVGSSQAGDAAHQLLLPVPLHSLSAAQLRTLEDVLLPWEAVPLPPFHMRAVAPGVEVLRLRGFTALHFPSGEAVEALTAPLLRELAAELAGGVEAVEAAEAGLAAWRAGGRCAPGLREVHITCMGEA